MAIGGFVAGRYTGTYKLGSGSATSIGIMEKGYEVSVAFEKDLIRDTDAYGASVVDSIHMGGNCFIQSVAKEWVAGILALVSPYQATPLPASGAGSVGPGLTGVLDSSLGGILVLTAVTGTAAQNAGAILSLTATYTAIAEGFDVRWLLGSEHRKTPWRLRVYLYLNSTVPTWFTVT